MCGIAGIWYLNNTPSSDPDKIRIMTDTLYHRGPDGEGFWMSDDNSLHLGHRRLSIIDLSDKGKQPMTYLNRYAITFNGEIYNYIEIRRLLKSKGYQFLSETDTEVVMAAYDHWGTRCVNEFDGMFAFVLYDIHKNELFCARDRFGEKPLHYYQNNNVFMFASEMKALHAGGADKCIDDYSMYLYLNMGLHEDPSDKTRTFFRTIKRLKPAHYILLKADGKIQQHCYWKVSPGEINYDISFDEACKHFRELFFRSVERRLRSDVPVGTSLSGGLDSSAVALTTHELIKGKTLQQCFSARFNDPQLDEGYYMNKVTGGRSMQLTEIYPGPEQLVQSIESIMYHQEEPFASASIYAQWEVFKLARQNNVIVLLDGQGADEVLAGYSHFFEPFFREVYINKGYKTLKQVHNECLTNNTFVEIATINKKFVFNTTVSSNIQFIKNFTRTLIGSDKTKYIHPELHLQFKKFQSPFNEFFKLNDALWYSTFISGLDKLLRFADRNSMAHSLEVRLPFLNHELVEFVFSLPSDYKIHQGWTKAPIRFGLEQILPSEIAWRKNKLGFQPPQKIWMKEKQIAEKMMQYQDVAVRANYINSKSALCWEGFITGVFISSQLKKS